MGTGGDGDTHRHTSPSPERITARASAVCVPILSRYSPAVQTTKQSSRRKAGAMVTWTKSSEMGAGARRADG